MIGKIDILKLVRKIGRDCVREASSEIMTKVRKGNNGIATSEDVDDLDGEFQHAIWVISTLECHVCFSQCRVIRNEQGEGSGIGGILYIP